MKNELLQVLVVDDDPFIIELLSKQLQRSGVKHISSARNRLECLTQIHDCDVVILDYELQSENGIDILKDIKSIYPDKPVIFLSGQEFITIAIRSLKFGAFDYIEKHRLNMETLLTTIRASIVESKIAIRQHRRLKFRKVLTLGFPG